MNARTVGVRQVVVRRVEDPGDPLPSRSPGPEQANLVETAREAGLVRDTTVLALASLAEERDRTTGRHLVRIEAYVRLLADHQLASAPGKLPSWARDPLTIARCAVLHDIGKVGIPDSVLLKPGRLDEAEQEIMRQHPRIGAELLDRIIREQPDRAFLRVARDIVAFHHEAWDGSGYPYGLFGDAIPVVAQLTAVADVFDALTSRRPYKEACDARAAVDHIRAEAGRHFAPAAVDALLSCLPAVLEIRDRLGDPSDGAPVAPSGVAGRRLSPSLPPVAGLADVTSPVTAALGEALIARRSGELVVRSGEVVGRIYVLEGRVAWAYVTSEREVLTGRLQREGVSAADLQAVLADCRQSGANVGETLVAWGLLGRVQLRGILLDHVGARVRAILELARPAVLFVPQVRSYGSELTFELRELLAETR